MRLAVAAGFPDDGLYQRRNWCRRSPLVAKVSEDEVLLLWRCWWHTAADPPGLPGHGPTPAELLPPA
jgi:hypothetical protein